jgi:hypothetical protein
MFLRKNYRHTRMDLGDQFIRFACDNRAGAQPFSGFRVFPAFPEPSKGERPSVFHGDRERQLWSGGFSPFIKAEYNITTGAAINANFITGLNGPTGLAVAAVDIAAVDVPPVANAGPNQTVQVRTLVTLDGSGSSDPTGLLPLTYVWSFVSEPAASGATLSNPTIVNPTFTPDAVGDYVIRLVVTDAAGLTSAPSTVTISSTRAHPYKFKAIKSFPRRDGVLITYYTWESSSGNLADIADCEVGELVTYPAVSADSDCMTETLANTADCEKGPDKRVDCYLWPDPWTIATPNPFIIWFPGNHKALAPELQAMKNKGSLIDHQRTGNPAPPYIKKNSPSQQTFQFCCPGMGVQPFRGYNKMPIVRSIDDPGSNAWFYTIIKEGKIWTFPLPLPSSAP